MATITTGSEKQIAWAQQLLDERIALMTRAAKGAQWYAEQLRADGSEQRAAKVAAKAAAITATVELLEQVTDAHLVIEERDRSAGLEYILHKSGLARFGTPAAAAAAVAAPATLRTLNAWADEAGL